MRFGSWRHHFFKVPVLAAGFCFGAEDITPGTSLWKRCCGPGYRRSESSYNNRLRTRLAPSLNPSKSVQIGSSAPLPLPRFISNIFLGYNNSRPMLPLSFRLVPASHFTLTITFALIVQSYSSTSFIQHASIQNFHCITPFCCHFFSSYCFTVAYFKPPVSTCSMVIRVDHWSDFSL
jgi:hypothetical protein